MRRNTIGDTGLSVTAISFGCSGIGNLFRKGEDDEAQGVLNHA